jgi:hypothetical protein
LAVHRLDDAAGSVLGRDHLGVRGRDEVTRLLLLIGLIVVSSTTSAQTDKPHALLQMDEHGVTITPDGFPYKKFIIKGLSGDPTYDCSIIGDEAQATVTIDCPLQCPDDQWDIQK